jgi:RNA polymerase subunit RPABC4/transcription elongation factor Spt4
MLSASLKKLSMQSPRSSPTTGLIPSSPLVRRAPSRANRKSARSNREHTSSRSYFKTLGTKHHGTSEYEETRVSDDQLSTRFSLESDESILENRPSMVFDDRSSMVFDGSADARPSMGAETMQSNSNLDSAVHSMHAAHTPETTEAVSEPSEVKIMCKNCRRHFVVGGVPHAPDETFEDAGTYFCSGDCRWTWRLSQNDEISRPRREFFDKKVVCSDQKSAAIATNWRGPVVQTRTRSSAIAPKCKGEDSSSTSARLSANAKELLEAATGAKIR